MTKGRLFLVPSPLGDNDPAEVIPAPVLEALQNFKVFVVEEVRTARRYLSKAGLKGKIAELEFHELNEHTEQAVIEGYVKFEYLKDDIYIYDKDRMLAYGKRSNRQLKIGSEFKIKVARASKAESLIDFDPVDFKTKKTDNGNRHNRRKGRKNNASW